MAIYDFDGTTHREIGKVYDFDGTTHRQQGKAHDNDGTTDRLLYTSEFPVYTNGVQNVSGGYRFGSNNPDIMSGGQLNATNIEAHTIFTNYQGSVTSNWTLQNQGWTKAFVQCSRSGSSPSATSVIQMNSNWIADATVAHGFNGTKEINISAYSTIRLHAYVNQSSSAQAWEYLYIYKIWLE